MKKYAVIVAGGSGLRMGSPLPKQFLLIYEKPVLWYTIHTFLKSYREIQIILVLPAEYLEIGMVIAAGIESVHPIQTVIGGNTRFHSVQNGLSLVKENSVVFVHDAVRCLLTVSLIHLCYQAAVQFGSAIPCIESRDSVRLVNANESRSINRKDVMLVQTPQTFQSELLLSSYQTNYKEIFTDDASVVEAAGKKIHLVAGEINNIKITRPIDLAIAEKLLDPPQLPV